jgi:hypothetical protein
MSWQPVLVVEEVGVPGDNHYDKVYQLRAHGQWLSPGTPTSSTTRTGCHDIAEILLKVSLKHQKSYKNVFVHNILVLLLYIYIYLSIYTPSKLEKSYVQILNK